MPAKTSPGLLLMAVVLVLSTSSTGLDQADEPPAYRASPPAPARGAEGDETRPDPDAPEDEAQGGRTAAGTPVHRRNDQCFPAETRNLFSEVDMVPSGTAGQLQPFDYGDGHAVTPQGRNAIRGQNTWMLWGEGNETFWGWLQQDGYGLVDFLVLLDSRARHQRFKNGGIVNQPGMKAQTDPGRKILGLYLDEADGDNIQLRQPATDIDPATGALAVRPQPPGKHPQDLFEPGDVELYKRVLAALPQDGVDLTIYGYPTGVVGLRLVPNPDFFGSTEDAARARRYWDERVVKAPNDAYYTDPEIQADPGLVRPFRVSMACSYCHIGPHPLNPPADPEQPAWSNLSSIIGNQYWSPPKLFANLTRPSSFLHQFLASQLPGTVDTSLVSTDHINNANTINAVFDVPARLARAGENPPERQSAANLLLPGVEDPIPSANPRHTPRVLIDGSDSIGVFGALARVYINIGTHSDEWARCHNPIIGFKRQRPFAIATLRDKSVYWRAAEKYRIGYLADFFTYKSKKSSQSITAPMKLRAAPGGASLIDEGAATHGRAVFLRNCAICHSSKQPPGFHLQFSSDWAKATVPGTTEPGRFTLPASFADWESFRKSRALAEYVRRIEALAGQPAAGSDAFLTDNFLSTDVRVPITLVGTNSGRAVATNAMRGQVWDNFSSEDYKSLPAVGAVRFYNPYSGEPVDPWGHNDTYHPPGGGPGYYRPASLISLWATAPYLHNNALGLYNSDPSVAGRLAAFEDGIDKLLWKGRRVPDRHAVPGDLRWANRDLAGSDPGFIYRTTEPTYLAFPRRFIRPLLVGLVGPSLTSFLSLYLWLGLAAAAVFLALVGRPRYAGFALLLLAVLPAVLVAFARLDRLSWAYWLVPIVPLAAALWFWLGGPGKTATRIAFGLLAIAALAVGVVAHRFVNGRMGDLEVGPIPQGTPVNLIMNLNPRAGPGALLEAGAAMARGMLRAHAKDLGPAQALRAFETEAGASLLEASKCPDFVLDRGHWFAEGLSDDEKAQLKAFLKTL